MSNFSTKGLPCYLLLLAHVITKWAKKTQGAFAFAIALDFRRYFLPAKEAAF